MQMAKAKLREQDRERNGMGKIFWDFWFVIVLCLIFLDIAYS